MKLKNASYFLVYFVPVKRLKLCLMLLSTANVISRYLQFVCVKSIFVAYFTFVYLYTVSYVSGNIY